MGLNHSRAKSFSHAYDGVKEALKKEPNLRIHTAIAIFAIILAIFLQFNLYEFTLLILTVFFVLTLELVNTAIESLVNLVSPEEKKEAKVAKDISAAVVLSASILAFIIGIILFAPKIIGLYTY